METQPFGNLAFTLSNEEIALKTLQDGYTKVGDAEIQALVKVSVFWSGNQRNTGFMIFRVYFGLNLLTCDYIEVSQNDEQTIQCTFATS